MLAQDFTLYPRASDPSLMIQAIYNLCIQQSIIYTAFALLILLIVTTIVNVTMFNSPKFSIVYNATKSLNFFAISCLFMLIFIKFLFGVFFFRVYADFISTIGVNYVELRYLLPNRMFKFNGSVLSDIILVLAFSSGMTCVTLLGEKNLSKYISNISLFSFFYLAIMVMVYTENLLIMFIGFEFLFLPTLYFVYKQGYVQRVDKTLRVLLY